jgi:hypothetical protein
MPRSFTLLLLASFCTSATVVASEDAESSTRALQRSLFKTGGLISSETLPAEPPRPERLVPPAPRLLPNFTPSQVPLSARELALQPTNFTPYDRYLDTVRRVIAELDPRKPDMLLACDLVRLGRGFRYTSSDPYRAALPSRTASQRAGDCKAKALWLYDRLGDPSALYVIGKLDRGSKSSHAWVYWRNQERWWILDPTNRGAPIAADSVSSQRYVPYYSFGRSGAFRHPATSLSVQIAFRTTRVEPVAGRSEKASAAPARKDKRMAKR